jgi:nitrate reductase NapAB chaperone NapD
MPVCGLVVTLAEHEWLRAGVLEVLTRDARVTVGTLQRHGRLPIVTDTDTLAEQEALWDEIARTPGVLAIDLAYEDFSDVTDFTSNDLPSRGRRGDDHGKA